MLALVDNLFFLFTKPLFVIAGRFGVNLKELERFLKFMVVGTSGVENDLGTLNLLVLLAGLDVLVANTISFSLAVLSNLTWNRLWTYPDSRSKQARSQLVQFILVNVVGWVIHTVVRWALTPLFTDLIGRLG